MDVELELQCQRLDHPYSIGGACCLNKDRPIFPVIYVDAGVFLCLHALAHISMYGICISMSIAHHIIATITWYRCNLG
jgi:hypothetical protein